MLYPILERNCISNPVASPCHPPVVEKSEIVLRYFCDRKEGFHLLIVFGRIVVRIFVVLEEGQLRRFTVTEGLTH